MGYVTQRQQPLNTVVIVRILPLVKEEAEDQDYHIARKYYKVGAAVTLAVCGSLHGNEVFMLKLAGLRKQIELGRHGV